MSTYNIEFDLHLEIPSWTNMFATLNGPTYRIYADGQLLAERDYTFHKSNEYIRESVSLNLEPGIHTVQVDQVGDCVAESKLYISNFTVNESASNITSVQERQISFRTR